MEHKTTKETEHQNPYEGWEGKYIFNQLLCKKQYCNNDKENFELLYYESTFGKSPAVLVNHCPDVYTKRIVAWIELQQNRPLSKSLSLFIENYFLRHFHAICLYDQNIESKFMMQPFGLCHAFSPLFYDEDHGSYRVTTGITNYLHVPNTPTIKGIYMDQCEKSHEDTILITSGLLTPSMEFYENKDGEAFADGCDTKRRVPFTGWMNMHAFNSDKWSNKREQVKDCILSNLDMICKINNCND